MCEKCNYNCKLCKDEGKNCLVCNEGRDKEPTCDCVRGTFEN